MGKIYIGVLNAPQDVYIGPRAVHSIYLGSTLIWSKEVNGNYLLTSDDEILTDINDLLLEYLGGNNE